MLTLAVLLTRILTDLRTAVARHTTRDPARIPVMVLAWARIGRTAARFCALFARWQAGTLPRPRPSRAGTPRPSRPKPAFPAGRAWLAAATDHHVRGHASQLAHLLAQPAMAEFLTAAPQAGRLLRPLCHMLGIPLPPPLQRPPRPTRPRPPRPRPAPAPETTPPPTPDRPLPRYVRAAVRAWRKKPL
ncbi:MAG: hypothetical protein IT555_09220 [Acetobacteraceae bacterium]|nr:hypothetical protein [Acetobacteraceae bacterium]